MAQIVINEISSNYTYNIGAAEFATVALPITASWGPAFMDIESTGSESADFSELIENLQWMHFPATSDGLTSFVQTFRGPASNYKTTEDYSYQMAITLLTAGYDVLVCRLCPGTCSHIGYVLMNGADAVQIALSISAKYPGTFGNSLYCTLQKVKSTSDAYAEAKYWNLIVYVENDSGTKTAVENIVFVFEEDHATDNVPYIGDVKSNYIVFNNYANIRDTAEPSVSTNLSGYLSGGTDTFESPYERSSNPGDNKYYYLTTSASEITDNVEVYTRSGTPTTGYSYTIVEDHSTITWIANKYYIGLTEVDATKSHGILDKAYDYAKDRYTGQEPYGAGYADLSDESAFARTCKYLAALKTLKTDGINNMTKALAIKHREWVFSYAYYAYYALTDKLNYAPNRIISPGWDDQDTNWLDDSDPYRLEHISPLHKKLMNVAYHSRCATALLDIPRSCARKYVYDESTSTEGYAQLLARIQSNTVTLDVNAELYSSHSALFAPWGQYRMVGMGRQVLTSPSMLALLIQRAQMLNQPLQYEWALPTNRKHNLRIGEMEYKVTKKLMDEWQSLSGVGVNIITAIPDLGTNIWGNSTLFEVPVATYQALANLSTRYLVNAVEGQAYKCGLSITFQYNNASAYENFYAGMTPLLDTMKNVGAIDDYYMTMAADIDGLAQVNANSVIGKIYLVIPGVINDITIDLIALPPGTDLAQFGA